MRRIEYYKKQLMNKPKAIRTRDDKINSQSNKQKYRTIIENIIQQETGINITIEQVYI